MRRRAGRRADAAPAVDATVDAPPFDSQGCTNLAFTYLNMTVERTTDELAGTLIDLDDFPTTRPAC